MSHTTTTPAETTSSIAGKVDGAFPPTSARTDEIGTLVEMARAAVGDRAVYLSTPITTGPRYHRWLKQPGSHSGSARTSAVTEPNIRDARKLAAKLRRRFPLLIDPTEVGKIPDWDQGDYRILWSTVIRQLVSLLIMRDGWEYSRGCAFEFLTAHEEGLTTLDRNLRPLSLDAGRRLLRRAIRRMQKDGVATEFQESLLQSLDSLDALSS